MSLEFLISVFLYKTSVVDENSDIWVEVGDENSDSWVFVAEICLIKELLDLQMSIRRLEAISILRRNQSVFANAIITRG